MKISIWIILISFIPLLIGIFFILREIIKRQRVELNLFLGILFAIGFSYFSGLMIHIFIDINPAIARLWKIGNMIYMVPLSVFVVLFLDSLNRESVEPLKLGVTLFIGGILTYTLLDPNSYTFFQFNSGDWFLNANPIQEAVFLILQLWSTIFFIIYAVRLIRNLPSGEKKYGWYFLGSLFIISIGPAILLMLPVSLQIPHIDTIINASGFGFFSYILSQNIEIFHLLPFKAVRLMVLDIQTEKPIFDYNFDDKKSYTNRMLYAGFLQGIRAIIKKSMNQGELREIRTKNGVILFNTDIELNLTFILISTKSSYLMKHALNNFKTKFVSHYLSHNKEIMLEDDKPEDPEITKLISKVFYFLESDEE